MGLLLEIYSFELHYNTALHKHKPLPDISAPLYTEIVRNVPGSPMADARLAHERQCLSVSHYASFPFPYPIFRTQSFPRSLNLLLPQSSYPEIPYFQHPFITFMEPLLEFSSTLTLTLNRQRVI